MTPVVSNATPIRYLVEIRVDGLLPFLFGKIFIPEAVYRELSHAHAPDKVRRFLSPSPDWLETRAVRITDNGLSALHPGEKETILLAEEMTVAAVLLDEKAARIAAERRNLQCIGTLRILSEGAKRGQIDIRQAVNRLRQTTFRANPELFERVLSGSLCMSRLAVHVSTGASLVCPSPKAARPTPPGADRRSPAE